jgi:hypothetical protein
MGITQGSTRCRLRFDYGLRRIEKQVLRLNHSPTPIASGKGGFVRTRPVLKARFSIASSAGQKTLGASRQVRLDPKGRDGNEARVV